MQQTHAAAALAASVIIAPVTPLAETDIENVPTDVALVVALWHQSHPVSMLPRLLPVPTQCPLQDSHGGRCQTRSELLPIHLMTRWKMRAMIFYQLWVLHCQSHVISKSHMLLKTGITKHTASEQCPTQVTRLTAAAACKPGKVLNTVANKAICVVKKNKGDAVIRAMLHAHLFQPYVKAIGPSTYICLHLIQPTLHYSNSGAIASIIARWGYIATRTHGLLMCRLEQLQGFCRIENGSCCKGLESRLTC
jgi:hypothetical protein